MAAAGKSKTNRVRLKDVKAKHARAILRWSHAIGLAAKFPYYSHELQAQSMETLRMIARLCPSWVHWEVVSMDRQELIRFILGDQPDQPLPPWPAPYQIADIPTGDEIRPLR